MPALTPRNLGISRQAAVMVTIGGVLLSLVSIAVIVVMWGLDDRSTPVILSVLASISGLAVGLVGALKSTEAADTASKTHQVAQLTASKTAALEQQVTSHCGEICPSIHCPLRQMAGGH